MVEKFDPAPVDRHAEDSRTAIKKDKAHARHGHAIEDTFPASDPISAQQPAVPSDGVPADRKR